MQLEMTFLLPSTLQLNGPNAPLLEPSTTKLIADHAGHSDVLKLLLTDSAFIKGKAFNQILSFMEETTCAPCYGCEGGDPDSAWDYVAETGLVTGECYPYTIPTCPPEQQPCLNFVATPECLSTCNATGQTWTPYVLSSAYDVGSNQSAIMTEIMTNGPVEACFSVYSDFVTYKSGVYQYQNGSLLGGHCIKIIGWGVESGLPYWLCNNSWTTTWGWNGQFKILRGQDECGIEDEVVAGLP